MSNQEFSSHFSQQSQQGQRNYQRGMLGSPSGPNLPFIADSITLVGQSEKTTKIHDPFLPPSHESLKQSAMYTSIKPDNVNFDFPKTGQFESPQYLRPNEKQPEPFNFTPTKVYSGNQNLLGSPRVTDSLETRSRQGLLDRRFVKKPEFDQRSLANTTNSRQLHFAQSGIHSPIPVHSPKKSYLNKFEALGPNKATFEQNNMQKTNYISGTSTNASQKLLGSPVHQFKSQSIMGSQQHGRRVSNNLGGYQSEKEKKAVFLNNKISEIKTSIKEVSHQIDDLIKRHNVNLAPVDQESLDKLEATVQSNQRELSNLNGRYGRLQKENQRNREILGKYFQWTGDSQPAGLQGCEALIQENEELRLKYSQIQSEHDARFEAKKAELRQMSGQQIDHESQYLGFRYANQDGAALVDMKRYLASLQEVNKHLRSGGGLNQSFVR